MAGEKTKTKIAGKGGRGASDKKNRSKSVRAGLQFPVSR